MSVYNLFSLTSSIFCCVILLITVQAMARRSQSDQQRALQLIYYFTLGYMLSELAWSFVDGRSIPNGRELNYLINCVDFIMLALVGYSWFAYYERHTPSALTATRPRVLAWRLPVLVLAVLTVSSCFTGWLFYIDAQNRYHQGPLYIIQFIGVYLYPLTVSIKGCILRRRMETASDKRVHTTFAMYALILAVFEIANIYTTAHGIYIHCFSLAVVLLYQFVNQQEQHITRDFLTQMNNRGALESYLSNRQYDGDDVYLLMIDLNHFKTINDKYGHTEGDRALKIASDALKKLSGNSRYFLARYGGDEFVVVYDSDSEEKIIELCQEIRTKIAAIDTQREYSLSVSVGYSRRRPEYTITQWIKEADERMYTEKAERQLNR